MVNHAIRTMDVAETASVIKMLVQKGDAPAATHTGVAPPLMLAKRKRDAEPGLIFQRQLMCLPTVSENVARKLQEKFHSMATLQEALRDKKNFPKIALDGKRRLGKTRIDALAKHLL